MRIVHVITKADVGGAQTHVVELATAQRAAGHEVTVIAGIGGAALQRLQSADVATLVVPRLAEAGVFGARTTLTQLERALAALDPDIVHGHSSVGGLLGRLAARRVRTPSIYTAHGWPFQAGASPSQRVQSLIGEWIGGHIGGGVICLTEHEASLARRWRVVPRQRVWVIGNGLTDVAPSQIRTRTAELPLRMVMVARFAPPKRQLELIDVALRLPMSDWTLTFVGDGPTLEACRHRAESAPGAPIVFAGHRDDVSELLADVDLAVLWSRYEGMPISVLEAMRAGVASVASDLPGVRAVLGADAGLVAADTDALAAHLRTLMNAPGQCDRLGAAARERFRSEFSIESVLRRTLDAYETVIRNPRSGPRSWLRGASPSSLG